MKPIIGVTPLWDEEKDSVWMLPGYLEGIQNAGGLPLVLPFTQEGEDLLQLAALCQGFLFTGGQDVDPALYGQTPLPGQYFGCAKRDSMEVPLLLHARDTGKPVLGICRGLQLINAALGGTLYQDLPLQHPSPVCHRQQAPYDAPAHSVRVLPDTPLRDCLGVEVLPVNSCHHQAARQTAPCLRPMAVAEDGITEALYMPEHRFFWAVQWHPEFSHKTDENSRKIFRAFVDAAAAAFPVNSE